MDFSQAASDPRGLAIGKVETASGQVFVVRSDGERALLQKGDPVFQGDTIETGEDGALSLTLADDSEFSLGQNGQMVMDELAYDAASGSGSANLTVLTGMFVFVSGAIAKTGVDAMIIHTPVMTIGVRGTMIAGRAGAEGHENVVTLLTEANGVVGEIAVVNDGGVQVLNQANQMLRLSSFYQAPPAPVVATNADVKSFFGATFEKTHHPLVPAEPALHQRGGASHEPATSDALHAAALPPSGKRVPSERVADVSAGTDTVERPDVRELRPEMEESWPPLRAQRLFPHDAGGDYFGDLSNPVFGLLEQSIGTSAFLSFLIARYRFLNALEFRLPEHHAFDSVHTDGIASSSGSQPLVQILGDVQNDVLHGTIFNDYIAGNDGNDQLYGHVGNDTLTGGNGMDRLYGGNGEDALSGDAHPDMLFGEEGNDRLFGGGGNDILVGGLGRDLLTGGAGADAFRYDRVEDGTGIAVNGTLGETVTTDVIADFQAGVDRLVFNADVFGFAPGSAVEGVNFFVVDGRYDGTNAGGGSYDDHAPALIRDNTGTIYYDANGSEQGYTVVARVEGDAQVQASDIKLE